MALGRRKHETQELWVATTDVARSPGHPFYGALDGLLKRGGFDPWVEKRCAPFYAERGRPGIPPGVYFRMLFIGYFEGIGSQRGIAWRCSDSLSLREFLGVATTQRTPDHSSLTVIRKRLPIEVFYDVFAFVLKLAEKEGLFRGKIAGIDATMLEANAAMKSIVRRDTGLAATSSVCRSGLATTAQGQTFYCENAGCPGSCSASGAPQGGEKKGTTGEMNCWCSALVFADGCGYLMTWAVVDDNGSIDWFWQGCQGPCPSPQNCLLGEGQVPGTDICECQ